MIRRAIGILPLIITAVTLGIALGSCSAGESGSTETAIIESEYQEPSRSGGPIATIPSVEQIIVRTIVRNMSVAELVGQMIMVGIEEHNDGSAVTRLDDDQRRMLSSVAPGGVILFGKNIETVAQVQALVEDLQRPASVPLIIATDHEGGLVSRLTSSGHLPATVMPSATLLGIAANVLIQRGDHKRAVELARMWGHAIGSELRVLGITMNMAPVADVDNADSPGLIAIQRRTFGSDPVLVATLVAASLTGMHEAGVTAVLKHFPGQGAAIADPHTETVALDHTISRLESVDLVPFVAGISAGARAIMTAHISYPMATGSSELATTSRRLITDILRQGLVFEGVVITDALNMDAVATGRNSVDLALETINAGADIMLKPKDPEALHAALVLGVKSGMLSRERLERSVQRIVAMKLQGGVLGPSKSWTVSEASSVLGSEAHQNLVSEIRSVARSGRE